MRARMATIAVIASVPILLSACADGGNDLKVGACTNADPTDTLSFDVKAVDCEDAEAKSRIVRRVQKADDCDIASVTQEDEVYCTVPHPPGSAPTKPAVGACTTLDPNRPSNVNIRLVRCTDEDARSRISERAKTDNDCAKGSVHGPGGEVFCVVPLRKRS